MVNYFLPVVLVALCGTIISAQSVDTLAVYFDLDKDILKDDQVQRIDSVLSSIAGIKTYEVVLRGYADFVGDSTYNVDLSNRRAKSIVHYLWEKHGDKILRIRYQGLGEYDPLAVAPITEGIRQHRKVVAYFIPVEKQIHTGLEQLNRANLQPGDIIIVQNLNFYAGRHILLPESIPTLKRLLQIMRENPTLHIQIEGHICCGVEGEPDGFDQDTGEKKLSVNRAENIFQYLVRNGIDRSRLAYRGFGYSRPIFKPEKNVEEQRANRRVEIRIIKL